MDDHSYASGPAPSDPSDSIVAPIDENANEQLYGFQRNLKAESVLGASVHDKRIFFCVKFEGIENGDWVTSEDARKHCPQLLLDYYESHARFVDT